MEPALDWLQWFSISLPVASCSLILVSRLLIASRPRPRRRSRPFSPSQIWGFLLISYRWEYDLRISPIKAHGDKFGLQHWFVVVVTLGTIGLWCIEKNLEQWVGDMGIIAVIPMVAFFGTKILSKVSEKVPHPRLRRGPGTLTLVDPFKQEDFHK